MNNWLTKIKTPNNLTRKLLGFFKTLLIGAVCGSFDKKKPLIISSIIGLLISQIIINCKKKKNQNTIGIGHVTDLLATTNTFA